MADISEKALLGLIADQIDVYHEEVTLDAALDGLGADDLDRVELAMGIEEIFDVEIPIDAEGKWVTVHDVIECVRAAKRVEVSP